MLKILDDVSATELLDPEVVRPLLGVAERLVLEELETLGYSGAHFCRLKDETSAGSNYFVKILDLDQDWFSRRMGDAAGREFIALTSPELARIHEIFESPYLIVAGTPPVLGTVMRDVSSGLLPDERAPISVDTERLILDALAELHACFWEAPVLGELSWLQSFQDFLFIMGPHEHEESADTFGSVRGIGELIRSGWDRALEQLPGRVRKAILESPEKISNSWKDLPVTLVHGDTKIANFAVTPGGGIVALDWAFVGCAPCTVDLGWYLAVNASRLSRPKEKVIQGYRTALEARLGEPIAEDLWEDLEEAGIVCGAMMLLWAKGAARAAGGAGAEQEWDWWVSRLERWVERRTDHSYSTAV